MWQLSASAQAPRPARTASSRFYTLDVFILSGPIPSKFLKQNPGICRTIAIRGDQTLEDLHHAIFAAFDREDEHMYEFQFGKGPRDPEGPRYVLPMAAEEDWGPPVAGVVTETTIDSLNLTTASRFGYWFDFGDDWMHQINVEAIADEVPPGDYPAVVKRVGESPPQYIDCEEEAEPAPRRKTPKRKGTKSRRQKASRSKQSASGSTAAGASPIPAEALPTFRTIARLVEAFCREHLNDEYVNAALVLTAKLATVQPSPLLKGKPESWACGIVRTIGYVNFLHDPSYSPHMKTSEIDRAFGVSEATGQAKSKMIRDGFDIGPFDSRLTVPSMMDRNPFVWILQVNGIPMDIRKAPRSAQEAAYRQGLIPYIPADRGKK
jgi:hypothetical protein